MTTKKYCEIMGRDARRMIERAERRERNRQRMLMALQVASMVLTAGAVIAITVWMSIAMLQQNRARAELEHENYLMVVLNGGK